MTIVDGNDHQRLCPIKARSGCDWTNSGRCRFGHLRRSLARVSPALMTDRPRYRPRKVARTWYRQLYPWTVLRNHHAGIDERRSAPLAQPTYHAVLPL